MDTPSIISVVGNFLKFVGEVVADLKRQDHARLDLELLRLKRQMLAERLEEFNSNLEVAIQREKACAEQSLISRGLGNSTVRESSLRAIVRDAAAQSEKAHREYNRAIEEIALLERKIQEQMVPGWKKLLRVFGFYRRSR